jgi:thymidine phosphorylase
MDAPLGRTVGNALEVVECFDTLKGNGPEDLTELSVKLAARMVHAAGAAEDMAKAEVMVGEALRSGRGLEKFRQVIKRQGGNPRVIEDCCIPAAPHRHMFTADRSGFVSVLDAELIGRATMVLGAGRNRVDDSVDPAVGAVLHAKPGEEVRPGQPIIELHHRDAGGLGAALDLLRAACIIADEPRPAQPLILETIA